MPAKPAATLFGGAGPPPGAASSTSAPVTSNFDPLLAVYTGVAVDALSEVASNGQELLRPSASGPVPG